MLSLDCYIFNSLTPSEPNNLHQKKKSPDVITAGHMKLYTGMTGREGEGCSQTVGQSMCFISNLFSFNSSTFQRQAFHKPETGTNTTQFNSVPNTIIISKLSLSDIRKSRKLFLQGQSLGYTVLRQSYDAISPPKTMEMFFYLSLVKSVEYSYPALVNIIEKEHHKTTTLHQISQICNRSCTN